MTQPITSVQLANHVGVALVFQLPFLIQCLAEEEFVANYVELFVIQDDLEDVQLLLELMRLDVAYRFR